MPDKRSPSILPYSSGLAVLYRVADFVVILASLSLAMHIRGIHTNQHYLVAAFLACAIFALSGGLTGLYRSWRGVSLWHEFNTALMCWIITVGSLLAAGFVTKQTAFFSRIAMGLWFVTTPLFLAVYRGALRYLLRYMRKKGIGVKKAAIAGAGAIGERLAQVLMNEAWMGYRVEGFYDDFRTEVTQLAKGTKTNILGNMKDLVKDAHEGRFDAVFIAFPMRDEHRIVEILDALGDTVVSVYFAPDFFVFDLIQSRGLIVDGIPIFSVFESPFTGVFRRWLKRIEDLIVASLALTVLAIPMAIIAIGVKLSSPGPVLFRQRRYGLDGREIEVWKFRTMTVCEDGKNTFKQATAHDSRVTPFGRFLRRTSLDEVPQFINVLQGRMSVVGPRPHAIAHNEQFRKLIPSYMRRHKVRPGITGLAQVNGWRGETDTLEKMQKRVEYDLEYLRSWSLWLDIKILALTVFQVVKGENAY